jgi:hypothetical protein
MPAARYNTNVFVNCPFDPALAPLFDAVIFAVFDCGYTPRCTLEIQDSGQSRIDKIHALIGQSRCGIHDISRTQPDARNRLPRFNMPFELGLFLGARRFGSGNQRSKACRILDRDRYRYQKYLSDIAGQDIRAHHNRVEDAITAVRDWLGPLTSGRTLPGGGEVTRRYRVFRRALPALCRNLRLDRGGLTFTDYTNLISFWLQEESRLSR